MADRIVTHTTVVADGVCRVSLAGEIDMSVTDEVTDWLRTAIDTSGCRRVELDLAQTLFLDSTGITALLRTRHYADQQGVVFKCVDPAPFVRRIFEVTGVAEHLT
ncbi:STAS domain-containing protein [Catellatospora sp. KI3]|uniref:STAS domain-containing protein n=1 Tax=Catellatospora sp. KI3 TaxID=3041620 RepID=UPI00248308E9|nr:STAS domain-containing protein [Catellatospora sp. KI3]MDI1462654.1 STAS domain-containing protein [Catellatospora sp. KI3]